jgi:hypothetical protein
MATTIFVPLLNEGTDVWRPVKATLISPNTYRIDGEIPDDEDWAFLPGAVVRCIEKTFTGGNVALTAVGLA